MCLYTKFVKNPKYKPSKKNRGLVPMCTDKRVLYIPVECGECYECRKKKAREWRVRVSEDLRTEFGYFVTLTFSDEAFRKLECEAGQIIHDHENEIGAIALRRFLERVRKATGKSMKHWVVSELGDEKDRYHLHAVMFGQKSAELCKKYWQYGRVDIGTFCNEKTVNYIVKYMLKVDEKHKTFKGRVFASPGIGSGYFNRDDAKRNKYNPNGETNETYKFRNGTKMTLPKYYRNHIYSDDEKELLWKEKLNKKIIWVQGEKCRNQTIEDALYIKHQIEHYQKIYQQTQGDCPEEWDDIKAFRRARKQEIREGKVRAKELRKTLKAITRTSSCARLIEINGEKYILDMETGEILG
jgi:hypothetical protein